MANGNTATNLSVVVQFDAASEKFSYSGDIKQGLIFVDTPQAWINFSLVTVNGKPGVPDAVFLTGLPVVWRDPVKAGQSIQVWLPPPTSEQTSLLMSDDNKAVITHVMEHFAFELNISYADRIYTSTDPAIVNRDIPPPDNGD